MVSRAGLEESEDSESCRLLIRNDLSFAPRGQTSNRSHATVTRITLLLLNEAPSEF